MQNAYSLRLKEAQLNERMRELADRLGAEAEAERGRVAALAAEKEAQRAAYEEQLREASERQQVAHACPPAHCHVWERGAAVHAACSAHSAACCHTARVPGLSSKPPSKSSNVVMASENRCHGSGRASWRLIVGSWTFDQHLSRSGWRQRS